MDTILNSILHQSFEFYSKSFEVYENGCCIQHEPCNTHISAEFSIFIGMTFRLIDNPTYIEDRFSLPTSYDDLLEDRVQYGRLRSIDYISGVSSRPIVCNIFPQEGILRFATPSPLRLIEFSGVFRLI